MKYNTTLIFRKTVSHQGPLSQVSHDYELLTVLRKDDFPLNFSLFEAPRG